MKYKVTVMRTSYSWTDIEVEADSEEQANDKALDSAGNFEFSEKEAEYSTQYTQRVC